MSALHPHRHTPQYAQMLSIATDRRPTLRKRSGQGGWSAVPTAPQVYVALHHRALDAIARAGRTA